MTVFSDDPHSVHDPRHPQPQTGADKMFAPIGLIWTNHPNPIKAMRLRHIFTWERLLFFRHVTFNRLSCRVFGHTDRFPERKRQQPKKDVSAPLAWAEHGACGAGKVWSVRNVSRPRLGPPATRTRNGTSLSRPGSGHRRAPVDPLPPSMAPQKPLSVAGYPADKSRASLWRQNNVVSLNNITT